MISRAISPGRLVLLLVLHEQHGVDDVNDARCRTALRHNDVGSVLLCCGHLQGAEARAHAAAGFMSLGGLATVLTEMQACPSTLVMHASSYQMRDLGPLASNAKQGLVYMSLIELATSCKVRSHENCHG